jgi:hypothetical protein
MFNLFPHVKTVASSQSKMKKAENARWSNKGSKKNSKQPSVSCSREVSPKKTDKKFDLTKVLNEKLR